MRQDLAVRLPWGTPSHAREQSEHRVSGELQCSTTLMRL